MRINFKVIKIDEPSVKSLISSSRTLTNSNPKYELVQKKNQRIQLVDSTYLPLKNEENK